ncbi:hypothetical protein N4T57_06570 [Campylobacter hepaticus]|uniref:Periplasmic protein n=1 Tax=Campylobacter hepaticus TaxID=1813019 RepID=A0A424Z335_9BACT|nr:hypothetical protein [Campylobacter hepaticus]AXP09469.1 hypothetical protein A2J15_007390 [Campylobacter hepaticus]MCZ0772786.1 hypothetical protein [Campylobacter hepaticus]MCZ0774254.1 hypothetical protein [Campylobacter hepaticus]MCZ0775506.1 hypothetical protein [Campylobacter hepaticus]MDX2331057.1 hypothetical protein [Campylobacter hepaticus]
MRFFLFIFCCVKLTFAQIYKGELFFYDLENKEIFAIVYNNNPMIPLFDRDNNQTSSSFLVINDKNGNLEIPLIKINDFWQDEQKKYKINSSKILIYDQKIYKGQNLGETSLELIRSEDSIRIKHNFINFSHNFQDFYPIHKGILSFEQIRQKPIFFKDERLSFEQTHYFYEDGISREVLELKNFVYDMHNHKFLKLYDLYDIENQDFKNLLHMKLQNACNECFEDLQNVKFNNNFLLDRGKLKICYLPFEEHFLDENICIEFNESELKEFKK